MVHWRYFAAEDGVIGVKVPAVLQERASSVEPVQLEFSLWGKIQYLKDCSVFGVKPGKQNYKWTASGHSDPFLPSLWQTCQAFARFSGLCSGCRDRSWQWNWVVWAVCSCQCVCAAAAVLVWAQDADVLFVPISWSSGQTLIVALKKESCLYQRSDVTKIWVLQQSSCSQSRICWLGHKWCGWIFGRWLFFCWYCKASSSRR